MPKVSVVMPVFNTKEEFLRESIESILNQTFEDFEFIIIDDGSTNNAPSILQEYKQKDNRIKLILGKHIGIAAALNLGIESAVSEYIARMDSDDISLPTRLEVEFDYLEKNKDISLVGSGINIMGEKSISKPVINVKILDVLNCCPVNHPSVMFRKNDFIINNLKYNEKYTCSEDYELWSRAIKILRIRNIETPLLKYRILENGNSRKNTKKVFAYDQEIRNNLISYLTDDKNLQKRIFTVVEDFYRKPLKFTECIFSIKNQIYFNSKYKVVTILGLKFRKKIKL